VATLTAGPLCGCQRWQWSSKPMISSARRWQWHSVMAIEIGK
jgi:hypothetical protein